MDDMPRGLEWISEGGRDVLKYGDATVGQVWKPKGKEAAAWKAGNADLGVPESGLQGASSLSNAQTACSTWVTHKSSLKLAPRVSTGGSKPCPYCNGTGRQSAGRHTLDCGRCAGSGWVVDRDPVRCPLYALPLEPLKSGLRQLAGLPLPPWKPGYGSRPPLSSVVPPVLCRLEEGQHRGGDRLPRGTKEQAGNPLSGFCGAEMALD
jgi:hypothetical protein